MIKLRFYNSLGSVMFDENGWHLTEAEGLSIPTKLLMTARYTNQPGQTTISSVANPRTITLSGDVNLAICGAGALSLGSVILDSDGILEVCTDRFCRQIKARCTELVFGERNGPFRTFVAQFICDFPYFEDIEYTERNIYGRTPMLSKDTVLPAVFSKRIAKGIVYYSGSAYSEPVIRVSVPEGSGILSISNLSTNEKIAVSYDCSLFSELIIDVENRTITDENDIIRLEILTDDSFFDGFSLRGGDNLIEVTNSDVATDIKVKMRYKVRYTEAVI